MQVVLSHARPPRPQEPQDAEAMQVGI